MSARKIRHLPVNDNGNGWSKILPPRTPKAALGGKHRCNWLVIGGGYVGLARENINRQLRAWRQDGLITVDAGHITIVDLDGLKQVADQID